MSYFLFVPLSSFFLCYPGEALEGQISTGVCKDSTMLIKITAYKDEKITILKIDSTVDIHRKNAVSNNMSIKVHMKQRERRNRLKISKLIGIKIQVLPTDAVAQWVEHRRDKPRTCVQILASVMFLICSVAFFLSLLPRRSVGRSNFDWSLQKLTIVHSHNDMQT